MAYDVIKKAAGTYLDVDMESFEEEQIICECARVTLGTLQEDKFKRGGDELAIPPKKVLPATKEEVEAIYTNAFEEEKRFCFSQLRFSFSFLAHTLI